MAVAFDVATENVRTGTTSPQTFSHAGAASGVKGVVVALVHGASSTDHVSAVSYGGVALNRVVRATDTLDELGASELWFLGSGVPQGTQTVSYTCGSTTDDIHAVCITLTGAADLFVVDFDSINENATNPSVTLQYGGRTAIAIAALYGGGASPNSFSPNGNCTTVHDHDLGVFYSEVIRQTTPGTSDFAIGGTSSGDDVAYVALAVTELLAVTMAADQGTYTLTGQDAEFIRPARGGDPAPLPSIGLVLDFNEGGAYEMPAAQGAYALTGQSAILKAGRQVAAALGSFAITGQDAALRVGRKIAAAAGSFAITGNAALTTVAKRLGAVFGSLAITGQSARLARDCTMAAALGTFAIAGQAATLQVAHKITAASGSFTILGHDATLGGNPVMVADQGAYALTGQDAGFRLGRALIAAQGAYTTSGQDATLRAGRMVSAAQGAYTLAGQAVAFTYEAVNGTGAPAPLPSLSTLFEPTAAYSFLAEQGSYSITGQPAALRGGWAVVAEQGAYAISGQAASLEAARSLFAGHGSFAIIGQAATLKTGRVLIAAQGTYALAGQPVAFQGQSVLAADPGSFAISGQPAALRGGWVLIAEQGSFALTGQAATLTYATATGSMGAAAPLPSLSSLLESAGLNEIVCAPGTYTITGYNTGAWWSTRLTADYGTYTLEGGFAAVDRVLVAANGAYTLLGSSAQLGLSGMSADPVTLTAVPGSVNFRITFPLSAGSVESAAGGAVGFRFVWPLQPASLTAVPQVIGISIGGTTVFAVEPAVLTAIPQEVMLNAGVPFTVYIWERVA